MLQIYQTVNYQIETVDAISPNCWINLIDPNQEEIDHVNSVLNLEPDFITSALDREESSRLEVENGQTLILINTPIKEQLEKTETYNTLPLAIILTNDNIVTVSLEESAVLKYFYQIHPTDFSTTKRNRFILQLLYRNAAMYLSYLKKISAASDQIEQKLQISTKNKELIEMLALEKSLVYFSTSLKSNEVVLEKLLKMSFIKTYPEDEDLLEDVIIENTQAIEMCHIYTDILIGTMDAYASIISNNLNIIMKFLTSITIVIAIPTLIASLWGMNVPVPFTRNIYGFWIVLGISLLLGVIGIIYMFRKKMF